MSSREVHVGGILHADGTLHLDETPRMSPGRVTVLLRHEREATQGRPPSDAFFRLMNEIWTAQKARGFVPRVAKDIEAERKRRQSEVQDEIDSAIRLQEESRRLRAENESQQP